MDIRPVLAIETSQALCSICLYISDDNYFKSELNLKNAHAEKIFDLISQVLSTADYPVSSVGSLAVSSGPGSFTGLRIGMSAAKGIAYGAGLPVIPVPTFEALAFQISSFLPENESFAIANKVNMEELYFAKFKVRDNNFIFTENIQIIKKEELDSKASGVIIFGNAGQKNTIYAPDSMYVAKWCLFAGLKPAADFDSLEPDYIKHFIIKEKKK